MYEILGVQVFVEFLALSEVTDDERTTIAYTAGGYLAWLIVICGAVCRVYLTIALPF